MLFFRCLPVQRGRPVNNRTELFSTLLAVATVLFAACGGNVKNSNQADVGSGGAQATGGSNAGGHPSTGGMKNTGSTQATGDTNANGGNLSTGGSTSTGGSSATGGTMTAGGMVSTGGIPIAGGSQNSGGTSAVGGTISNTLALGGAGGAFAAGGYAGTSKTGGTLTAGTSAGGAFAAGGYAGDSGAGDAGGCIDVCGLYGAPCCSPAMGCVTPGGGCVIDVLAGAVGTTYQYADLEQKVASMSQDVLVSMTDADFDWVAADPPAAGRFQLHMTPDASASYGALGLSNYPTHPFRFSCGGQSLFLGVMYIWYGQAALETPVMDAVSGADNTLSLYLGASEGAWGAFAGTAEARERIDRPEFRAVFCQRAALRELAADAMPPNP